MSRFHFSDRSNFYGKKFKFLGQYVYVPSISSQKLSLMILTNPSSLTNETALLSKGGSDYVYLHRKIDITTDSKVSDFYLVELSGIEPLTSSMPLKRSTN
jgi:hypothetical protein